jgi:hypothetical protein
MKPYLLYANHGGETIIEGGRPLTRAAIPYCRDVDERDLKQISRREFLRRSGLLVPLIMAGTGLWLPSRARAGSTIKARTISSATETAISLSNSTFARPVTLPVGWNKVRLGIRFHGTNSGVTLTGSPDFSFGFASGTTGQYGDASTTHFVGVTFNFNATWTWFSTAGPTSNGTYEIGGSVPRGRVRIGTTNSDVNLALGGAFAYPAAAGANVQDANVLLFDIAHGSPNYTWTIVVGSGNSGGIGATGIFQSSAQFLLMMGQTSPTAPSGYGASGSQSQAVNEGTNGTLNAINLSFNRSDVTMEVVDHAVAVIA